jgi:hypothetical protein
MSCQGVSGGAWGSGDSMVIYSVNEQFANWRMAVEIVDLSYLPINNGDFPVRNS